MKQRPTRYELSLRVTGRGARNLLFLVQKRIPRFARDDKTYDGDAIKNFVAVELQ
jgi:hypothetical protein